MGTVWQGHDELLGREVAIKEVRFPPELGRQEIADLRERTLREARATARLSHPNVITTYDVVEEDGRPWIVMELLKTHSLSEVLRDDGPLPPHRVAEIGLGVLAALETAHAQGVVHRDVKPSNVLVTADGRPVLTDFGIATMAGDPALTSTGVVLGSPAYMSPERARGKALRPGERPVVARRDALRRRRGPAAVRVRQRPRHADCRHLRPGAADVGRRPARAGRRRPAAQGPAGARQHRHRPGAAAGGGGRQRHGGCGTGRGDRRTGPGRAHRGVAGRRRRVGSTAARRHRLPHRRAPRRTTMTVAAAMACWCLPSSSGFC